MVMHIPRVTSDWVDAGLLKRPEEGETMEREGELVIQLPGRASSCLSWGLLSQHSVVTDCSIRANPLLRKSDHIPWALEQTTFPGGTVDSMLEKTITNQLMSMNNCNEASPFSTGFIIIVINFGALSRVSLFSHIFLIRIYSLWSRLRRLLTTYLWKLPDTNENWALCQDSSMKNFSSCFSGGK